MTYTIGQLETLLDFMKERQMRYINTEFPPAEVCKRIRDRPHIGWCTILRGQCICDTKGCYLIEVKDKRKGGK